MHLGVIEGGICGAGCAVDIVGWLSVKAANGETDYVEGSVSCVIWMEGVGSRVLVLQSLIPLEVSDPQTVLGQPTWSGAFVLNTVLMKPGGQIPVLEPDPAMGCAKFGWLPGVLVSCVEAVPGATNSWVPGGCPVGVTPRLELAELAGATPELAPDTLHGDALLPAAIDKTTKKSDNIF